MLFNYFATALRNLARNRLYAAINIAGLALGCAAAIFIGLFVRDELTFDRFIPGYERIYRIEAQTSDAAGKLKAALPQIEDVTRLQRGFSTLIRNDVSDGESSAWVDANFFDMLPLPTVAGDLQSALARPDGVVVTRAIARKYFGRDAPIGEILAITPAGGDSRQPMRITAVIDDLPSNTHLAAKIFLPGHASFSPFASKPIQQGSGMNTVTLTFSNTDVYVRLKSQTTAAVVRAALPQVLAYQGTRETRVINMLNIAEIHLSPPKAYDAGAHGDLATIYAMAAIGALILLAASINFINLMTARATRRALEVGVRKAAGARRRDLILQFTGESLLYASFGALAAAAIVELALPAFNAFMDRTIVFDYWRDPWLFWGLTILIVGIGVVAGSYPAFVLSALRPDAVLKGARGGNGSQQKAVPAISFYVAPAEFETLHVKLARDTIPQAVEEIEQTWKRINGMKSFRVRFLSRAVEEDYANLQRETHMAGALAAVALFIGCLGLFGLSAFNAERRTKEIGVRKAMGASKTDVMRLLVWQFMKPVLWANLIAWPVGAWLMQRWLNGFAYHIDLSPWIFVAASATALAIALITVAGHCWFAAKAHPVNALRDE